MAFTAAAKPSPWRAASPSSARASISKVRAASCSARGASKAVESEEAQESGKTVAGVE